MNLYTKQKHSPTWRSDLIADMGRRVCVGGDKGGLWG